MMQRPPSYRRRLAAGFTLIEIAIVMVVIGLLLSGGLLAFAPNIEKARISRTNASLDRIEQALRTYAIRYGCLPCPANGSIPTGTTDFGRALNDGGTAYAAGCAGAGVTCQITTPPDGTVPWVTLGLSEEDIVDGWENRISYYLSVAPDAVFRAGTTAPCPARGAEATYSSGICRASMDYPEGNLTIRNAALTVDTTTAAVYVLISHGQNSVGARAAVTGTLQGGTATAAQTENTDGDTIFVQDSRNEVEATFFDDIVRWRTAPAFIESCGDFACGN